MVLYTLSRPLSALQRASLYPPTNVTGTVHQGAVLHPGSGNVPTVAFPDVLLFSSSPALSVPEPSTGAASLPLKVHPLAVKNGIEGEKYDESKHSSRAVVVDSSSSAENNDKHVVAEPPTPAPPAVAAVFAASVLAAADAITIQSVPPSPPPTTTPPVCASAATAAATATSSMSTPPPSTTAPPSRTSERPDSAAAKAGAGDGSAPPAVTVSIPVPEVAVTSFGAVIEGDDGSFPSSAPPKQRHASSSSAHPAPSGASFLSMSSPPHHRASHTRAPNEPDSSASSDNEQDTPTRDKPQHKTTNSSSSAASSSGQYKQEEGDAARRPSSCASHSSQAPPLSSADIERYGASLLEAARAAMGRQYALAMDALSEQVRGAFPSAFLQALLEFAKRGDAERAVCARQAYEAYIQRRISGARSPCFSGQQGGAGEGATAASGAIPALADRDRVVAADGGGAEGEEEAGGRQLRQGSLPFGMSSSVCAAANASGGTPLATSPTASAHLVNRRPSPRSITPQDTLMDSVNVDFTLLSPLMRQQYQRQTPPVAAAATAAALRDRDDPQQQQQQQYALLQLPDRNSDALAAILCSGMARSMRSNSMALLPMNVSGAFQYRHTSTQAYNNNNNNNRVAGAATSGGTRSPTTPASVPFAEMLDVAAATTTTSMELHHHHHHQHHSPSFGGGGGGSEDASPLFDSSARSDAGAAGLLLMGAASISGTYRTQGGGGGGGGGGGLGYYGMGSSGGGPLQQSTSSGGGGTSSVTSGSLALMRRGSSAQGQQQRHQQRPVSRTTTSGGGGGGGGEYRRVMSFAGTGADNTLTIRRSSNMNRALFQRNAGVSALIEARSAQQQTFHSPHSPALSGWETPPDAAGGSGGSPLFIPANLMPSADLESVARAVRGGGGGNTPSNNATVGMPVPAYTSGEKGLTIPGAVVALESSRRLLAQISFRRRPSGMSLVSRGSLSIGSPHGPLLGGALLQQQGKPPRGGGATGALLLSPASSIILSEHNNKRSSGSSDIRASAGNSPSYAAAAPQHRSGFGPALLQQRFLFEKETLEKEESVARNTLKEEALCGQTRLVTLAETALRLKVLAIERSAIGAILSAEVSEGLAMTRLSHQRSRAAAQQRAGLSASAFATAVLNDANTRLAAVEEDMQATLDEIAHTFQSALQKDLPTAAEKAATMHALAAARYQERCHDVRWKHAPDYLAIDPNPTNNNNESAIDK